MKHLSALHTRVNNPYNAALESMGEVAMEGMADAIKEKWSLLKSAFKPNDAARSAKQIETLSKARKDLLQARGALAQAKDPNHTPIKVKMTGNLKKLPVDAKNADELISGLAAWRKKTEAQVKKIGMMKDEVEATAAAKQLQFEAQRQGNIAEEMTFTREQALKLMDEMVACIDATIGCYRLTVEAQKKSRTEGVATESFADAETVDQVIALEGIGEALWGALKLYIGYMLYVFGMMGVLFTIGMVVMGAFFPALVSATVTYALLKGGNMFFMGGLRNIDNTVQEAATKPQAAPAQ